MTLHFQFASGASDLVTISDNSSFLLILESVKSTNVNWTCLDMLIKVLFLVNVVPLNILRMVPESPWIWCWHLVRNHEHSFRWIQSLDNSFCMWMNTTAQFGLLVRLLNFWLTFVCLTLNGIYCLCCSLRTSETNYLNESYAFYSAIRMRGYYSKANKEERCVFLFHTGRGIHT